MAFQNLLNEYMAIPPITRGYSTLCVVTTLCVHLDMVTPFQLYFNPTLILKQYQLWRLLTTFLYFGTISFSFVFNMIFTYRYCRMLEENSFRGRTADFMMMFIFGGVIMIFFAFFVHLIFLGQAFTIMIVYIWSRRNPYLRMNFFGLLNFQAPYLPYVLLAFSVILGNTVWVDLMGMAVGHIYYFLEDVFPNQPNGCKLLKTPQILKNIFDQPPDDTDYGALPEAEDRPGGFNWGGDRPPPPAPAGDAADAQQQPQEQQPPPANPRN